MSSKLAEKLIFSPAEHQETASGRPQVHSCRRCEALERRLEMLNGDIFLTQATTGTYIQAMYAEAGSLVGVAYEISGILKEGHPAKVKYVGSPRRGTGTSR
jgi:hypothetical protein